MAASALSGRPPPAPHPPYMFTTPPPTWTAPDFTKPTTGQTHWCIIRTPHEPGTKSYVAADIKSTMETQAIMTQWSLPHDNYQAPIKMPNCTQHSVDVSVEQTMGCMKWRIVRTQHEPGTRVYAGVSAAAPFMPTTKLHAIMTLRPQDDMAETTVLSSTANLTSLPPFQQPTGANQPDDKPYYLLQLETKDTYTAGLNPTTPTNTQPY